MDYLQFYHKINLTKKIKTLEKKYKNKRIVIYGAGIMARILFQNYDVSGLNIVGVSDRKYTGRQDEKFFGYPALSSEQLKTFDCDVILVLVKDFIKIIKSLKYELLLNTKNENVVVDLFINLSLLDCLEVLISEKNKV